MIGFDTETELAEPGRVPRLAVAQAFDGKTCFLIHPSDLGRFIRDHTDCSFVGHNMAGFDYQVVHRHLKRTDRHAAKLWVKVANQGRIGDTMILDQLIRIARGSAFPRERDLATVADKWAGIELDKSDPWRLRYGEIIGQDWGSVDSDAWTYAAKDAIAARIVYVELRNAARRIVHQHGIDPKLISQYGILTHRLQVQAAIALAAVSQRGLCVDVSRRQELEDRLRKQQSDLVDQLDQFPDFAGTFHRSKDGQLKSTPTGKPRIAQKRLREVLERFAMENEIEPPRSAKTRVITLSKDFWKQHVEIAPFIKTWLSLEETAKLIQFFAKLQDDTVYSRYTTIVRTGRTSCSKPNVQQMPRASGFREIFVPRPGHVLLTIDYSAVELRTLASVCETQFGYSKLADVVRAGSDPHVHTAATLMGIDLEQFAQLPDDERKQRRQAAKAVNFGVPGGLGPAALSQYARLTYGTDLSVENAEAFREQFLTVIYPEVGEYMESDMYDVLAGNLMCDVDDLTQCFRTDGLLRGAKGIIAGRKTRRDGKPYTDRFVDSVWRWLRSLNNNPHLSELINHEVAGTDLEKRLFFGTVITETGRPRGRATFTQRRNTPFQGMAADGAKIALWELHKAGYRTVAFVHDEFLIELPEQEDYRQDAKQIDHICCQAMQQVTGTVPIECEYALAYWWSKEAAAVWDEQGRLVVWQPKQKQIAKIDSSKVIPAVEPKITASRPASDDKSNRTPGTSKAAAKRESADAHKQKRKRLQQDGNTDGKLTQPLKWFGGKHYLATKIIALMPEHVHYLEPFFGGGSVLLKKQYEGVSEVINDRYECLSNFWKVIASPRLFEQFYRRIEVLPFSQKLWEQSQDPTDDPVEAAVRFFVFVRQSRAGQMKDFATMSRNRTRRGMNEQASAWLTAVAGLPQIHARLRRVVVLNDDAVSVIQKQDGPNTCHYCDPPYLHETRTSTNEYAHEMTEADHRRLLDTLRQCKGKVLLSGYPSKLYGQLLQNWNRQDFKIDNKASGSAKKRKMSECVWMNY